MSIIESPAKSDAPIFIRTIPPLVDPREYGLWWRLRGFLNKRNTAIASVIGLPIVYGLFQDRFWFPEITLVSLAVTFGTLFWMLRFPNTTRGWFLRAVILLMGIALSISVLAPYSQRRFARSHMLSTARIVGKVRMDGDFIASENSAWVSVNEWLTIPGPIFTFLSGKDFFSEYGDVQLPNALLTQRNLNRWNFEGLRVDLIDSRPNRPFPTLEMIQQLNAQGGHIGHAVINGWDPNSLSMVMANGPWLSLTIDDRIEKELVESLMQSPRAYTLVLNNITGIDPECEALLTAGASTSTSKANVMIQSCKLTPELLRFANTVGTLHQITIESPRDAETFRSVAGQVTVRYINWIPPITTEDAKALSQVNSPYALFGEINWNDDTLTALRGAKLTSLYLSNRSFISDRSVDALLSFPSLTSLNIPSSSMSADAILRLVNLPTLVNFHIVSDSLTEDEIQTLQAQTPTTINSSQIYRKVP